MRAYTLRVRARTKEIEMTRKKSKQKQKLTEKRIGFGKYSGTRWRELPTEYLKWICREMDTQSIQDKAANVLYARGTRDFERKSIKKTKKRQQRGKSDPVLPQLDEEFRDIVTG